jgi:RNA polymerase sigma factor (sigma-70 family)
MVIDKDEVNNALENLSEKEQLIVSLSADGYSQAEIAEILGYKDNKVVANLLQRIRKKNTKDS